MIDLSHVIELEAATSPIALTANTGGTYDSNGKWVANATVNRTIVGTMQPAKDGERLVDDRNGTRVEIKFFLWTKQAIQVDDRVTYRGETFRVIRLWDRADGSFYKASLGVL